MMNILSARQSILLAATVAASLVAGVACSGGSPPAEKASPVASAAPKAAASAAPTGGGAAAPAAAGGGAAAPAAAGGADPLLAKGKEIYEKTAGGVGCAACHGMDGKGNGPAGVGAPANRGASEDLIREKLSTVELMASVKLTADELKAVAAYTAFLAKQP